MGRPKKYSTDAQRLAAIRANNKKIRRITGKYWRLVVPALASYGVDWTYESNAIRSLRASAVDLLVQNQQSRGLSEYLVAVERHPGTRMAHLDILMVYNRRIYNTYGRYDYIIKHGNLTKYRTVNAAILEYGRKEDPNPIGNLDVKATIMKSRVKSELYTMMYEAMVKKPFKFDPIAWLTDSDIASEAIKTNVFKVIRMVRQQQNMTCNRLLRDRSGIRFISRQMIESTLSKQELELYDSWSGYQTIVDHINQIPTYKYCRPHKTSNLFLTGPPNIGKSSLIIEIQRHCPVYPLGTKHGWFPSFKSEVYSMLSWDQFNLRCYPYTDLLKLLEGRPMKLPIKGGHVERADNQLIICTSNLSLERHIRKRFRLEQDIADSIANLGVRFTEVVVPVDRPLFILCKLIKG